jgi:hypothetical protein
MCSGRPTARKLACLDNTYSKHSLKTYPLWNESCAADGIEFYNCKGVEEESCCSIINRKVTSIVGDLDRVHGQSTLIILKSSANDQSLRRTGTRAGNGIRHKVATDAEGHLLSIREDVGRL